MLAKKLQSSSILTTPPPSIQLSNIPTDLIACHILKQRRGLDGGQGGDNIAADHNVRRRHRLAVLQASDEVGECGVLRLHHVGLALQKRLEEIRRGRVAIAPDLFLLIIVVHGTHHHSSPLITFVG